MARILLAVVALACAASLSEAWGPWGGGHGGGPGGGHGGPGGGHGGPPDNGPGSEHCKQCPWEEQCKPRGGKGDPVFTGFDDTAFVFLGKAGSAYNVIASPDTQLNMQLVDAELPEGSQLAQLHPGQDGTFMSSFGLRYMDQLIEVDVDRMGILTSVKLNGTEQLTSDSELHMDADIPFVRMRRDIVVNILRYRPFYGQSVKVQTPDFDFMFYPTLAYLEEATGARIRGHLNVQVLTVHLTRDEASSVTGIMGDTLRLANEDIFAGKATKRVDEVKLSEIQAFNRPEAAYEVPALFDRPDLLIVRA